MSKQILQTYKSPKLGRTPSSVENNFSGTTPITADATIGQMQGYQPLSIPQINYNQANQNINGVQNSLGVIQNDLASQLSQYDNQSNMLQQRLLRTSGELGNVADYRNSLYDAGGLDEQRKNLRNLYNKTQMAGLNMQQFDINTDTKLANQRDTADERHLSMNALGKEQQFTSAERNRDRAVNALEAASVAVQYNNLQGAYSDAEQAVNRAVDAYTQPRQQALQTFSMLYNQVSDKATGAQKDLLNTKLKQAELVQKELEEKRQLAVTAGTNGAKGADMQAILDAPDINSAYVAAGEFLQKPVDPLDAQYKQAQIANLNGTTASDAGYSYDPSTGTFSVAPLDSAGALYAQQYASNGLANIPKEYVSQAIAQGRNYSKPGSIIDANTGVRGTLDTGVVKELETRKALLDKAKNLQQLYNYEGGGTLSSNIFSILKDDVLGNKKRQEFNEARLDFVDLIGRARTGAVIGPAELVFYEKMLPNDRFELPGGKSRKVKLDNLVSRLQGALDSGLESNGAKIKRSSEALTEEENTEYLELQKEFGDINPDAAQGSASQNIPTISTNATQYPEVQPVTHDFNTGVKNVVEAVAAKESGGNYKAIGPVVQKGLYKGQQALGKYQVMPGNLAQWSKLALGRSVTPQEFLSNPQLQDAIVQDQFARNIRKYGNIEDAVSTWFSGQPVSRAGNVSDGQTTVPEYLQAYQGNIRNVLNV